MWINGVPQDLGLAPGYFRSISYAVNAAGTVAVGTVSPGGNVFGGVWTPATGMVTLETYLASYGVTMPASTSSICTGVSDDGRTIVGYGNFGGQTRGFVATVPAPGAALPLLALLALRRRR